MKSKITKQDKIFIFISTILLITGVIFQVFMFNFNELIKTNGGTIFSAQVTITALSISIIAIISGVLNDTLHGINIGDYIVNKKNMINNKIYIFISLIIVGLGVIFLISEMYILLLFIFALSVVIIGFMVNDVFSVFKGKENLKENIENYIINTFKREDSLNLKKDMLQNLRKETISLYDNNDYIYLEDNLKIFKSIFEDGFHDDVILDLYENIITNLCETILEKGSNKVNKILLNFIIDLYQILNKTNNFSYEKFNVFNNIGNIVIAISRLKDKNEIASISYSLLSGVYQYEGKRKGYANHLFLYALYKQLKRDGQELYSVKQLNDINIKIYNTLILIIKYPSKNLNYINAFSMELSYYVKVLFDNDENEILKNTFFEKGSKVDDTQNDTFNTFILRIYIYIYILKVYRNKEINIISENISILIFYCHIKFKDITFVSKLKKDIGEWEFPDLSESNELSSSYISCANQSVNDFVIFTLLERNTDKGVRNSLEKLDSSIINSYKSNKTEFKNELLRRYNVFSKIFKTCSGNNEKRIDLLIENINKL